MNPQDYSSQALAEALGLIGQGIQTQAMRPYKSSQTTTTTTQPVEYADMLARRNQIGAERQALSDALKKRESFGYSLASALSAIPHRQGYGSWLGNLGRSFGAGFNARTNAAIDRAQQDYEAAQKDLASALALDKAMGDVQTQVQNIDYKPMEYGTAGKTDDGFIPGQKMSKEMAGFEAGNQTLADLYATIDANPITFSSAGVLKQGEESRGLKSWVNTAGVTDLGHNEFAYLQNIMPGGFATAINTATEQRIMRPYTTAFAEGTGSQKKAAIVGMLGSIYDTYAAEAKQKGIEMPLSREDYIDSRLNSGRIYNPKYLQDRQSQPMYFDNQETKIQPVVQQRPNIDVKSNIPEDMQTKLTMSVDLNSIKSGENKVMPGDVITFSDGSTVTFKGDGSESDRQILEALQ